jgi:hypothetical protein
MAGFQRRFEEAAGSLLGALPIGCGTPEGGVAASESRLGVQLPAALRDYYLGIGGLRKLNAAHNRLLAPEGWFLNDGELVFMVENQGVLYWGVSATEPPDDDPPVSQGVNHLPQSIEWHPEHERCSEFLLMMMHWQAVCGGLDWTGMADVGQEIFQYLQRHWQLVGRMEGMIAYCRPGQAACVIGEGDAQQLYVGANSESMFEKIRAELEGLGMALDQL